MSVVMLCRFSRLCRGALPIRCVFGTTTKAHSDSSIVRWSNTLQLRNIVKGTATYTALFIIKPTKMFTPNTTNPTCASIHPLADDQQMNLMARLKMQNWCNTMTGWGVTKDISALIISSVHPHGNVNIVYQMRPVDSSSASDWCSSVSMQCITVHKV